MTVCDIYCVIYLSDGFVKVVQAMTTERIEEIASLENELDTQDANELQQIRKTCFDLIHSQLLDIKEKTAGDLKNCGKFLNKFHLSFDLPLLKMQL